jgi:hypothetical protein
VVALQLKVLPKLTKSNTLKLVPARVLALTLKDEPRFTLSSTDKLKREPKYVKLLTDSELPKRANARRLTHEPACCVIITLQFSPNLAKPLMDIVDPKFAKLNTLVLLPRR